MKKLKMLSLIALCAIGVSCLSSCTDNNDNTTSISTVSTFEEATYKVEYYYQKEDLSDYELESVVSLKGEIGKETNVDIKNIDGFIVKEINKVIVNADGSSIAKVYYDRNMYGLVLHANNTSYGKTTGTGAVKYGSKNQITAEASAGYKFVGWYLNNELVSELSSIIYTMPASNIDLEARFVPNDSVSYKINVYYQHLFDDGYNLKSSTVAYGNIGAQTKAEAPNVTGYRSKSIEQVTIKGDGSTVVNVYYDRVKTDVIVSSNNSDYGTVTGSGEYKYGATATINASVETGCRFLGWYDGENLYSSKNKVTLTIGETDIKLVARFEQIPVLNYTVNHYLQNIDNDQYTLLESDNSLSGKVNTETSAVAKSLDGFTVKSFNQEIINADGSTEINIYYDRNEYEISNTTNDSTLGTISGNGKYRYDEEVELTATPKLGYKFVGWFIEGETEPISILSEYKFKMPANNISYEAKFEIRTDIPYKVNHYQQKISNDEYELVFTDDLEGKAGDTTLAVSKPYEGFNVVDFSQTTINADGTTEINIYYNRQEYALTITLESTHITLANDISGTYRYGTPLNLKITPDAGYVFTGWYCNGELFDENLDLDLSFTMPVGQLDLVASAEVVKTAKYTINHYLEQSDDSFKIEKIEEASGDSYSKTNANPLEFNGYSYKPFKQEIIEPTGTTVVNIYYTLGSNRVILSKNMEIAGTISGDGSYKSGAEATLIATPNSDYEFVGWYHNDTLKSTLQEFKYIVNEGSIRLEARFKLKEGIENLIIDESSGNRVLVGIKDTTIKELVIPNDIDEIQKGALKGCSNLEKLTIPFVGAKRYTEVSPIDAVAFGYIFGSEGYNNSYVVNQKNRYANFSDYYLPVNLKTITITDTTIIQDAAFSYCNRLVYINLPDNLKSIGEQGFYDACSLVTITIPESVTHIGDMAFCRCYSLVEVYNLSNVEADQGTGPAVEHNHLASSCDYLHTSLSEKSRLVIDGDFIFEYYEGNHKLMLYTGTDSNVIIPDKFNYEGTEVNKFSIYRYAFYNNIYIRSIVLPNSITDFVFDPFEGCINLKEVYNLTSKNITCGSKDNGYVAYYAAVVYTSLIEEKKIFITDDGYLFGINKDNTLTLSSYSGFDIELKLPTKVVIDDKEYTSYNISNNAFAGNTEIVKVVIPSCVTSIGDSAFKGCSNLETVILPYNLTRINNYTFSGCSSLKSIELPNDFESFGEYVFYNCSSLEEITIPSKVKNISESLFENSGLKKINLSEGLETISESAFEDCANLASINIPDSVTTIVRRAFKDCYALETVHLGKGIVELKDYIFGDCHGLKTINLENITSIGKSVFDGCKSLESITLPESITVITDHLFSGCTSLKSITFKAKITKIEDSAFAYCNSLETIELTDSLVSVGTRAFEECWALKEIVIPNSVQSIGEYAFKGCKTITYLVLPSNTLYTAIGKSIIYSSANLETVVISKYVTSMNSSAVNYCPKFKNVFFYGTEAELNNWSLKSDSQISSKTFYYYSETQPASGNAWHYDSTGKPVAW